MIKDMFKDMPILSSIMALLIVGIIFILIDGINTKPKTFYGRVLDKHYISKKNRTGMVSTGKTGVIITSETEPEKFLIIVKAESGKIVTVKSKPELYYDKKKGDEIECVRLIGSYTGNTWGVKAVK